MPESGLRIVSSAVVSVMPGALSDVVSELGALPETDVTASGGNKIVVVLEGHTRGEVGARLAQIALMDGVVTANMVFEHVEDDKGLSP